MTVRPPESPTAPQLAGGVSAARRLHKPAVRRAERRFLVEGPQAVREARGAGALLGVFATERAALIHQLLLAGLPVTIVSERALLSLAETVTPQGVVGVAATLDRPVNDHFPRGAKLVPVLVDVRDPGNAGAVIRVADAAGADVVVVADTPGSGSVDPHNGKCVRASAGSLFHLPIRTGSLADTLDVLRGAGFRVLAADGRAAPYLDLDSAGEVLKGPVAFLFGNEAHGLGDEVLAAADDVVRVPIHGGAESLNLAVAAAICLYAAAREQRRVEA